jgi:hypothetical protein
MSQPGTASASRFLISSHSLPLPRFFIKISANSPLTFSPYKRNFKSPRAICSSTGASPSNSHVPRSHSITLPAP